MYLNRWRGGQLGQLLELGALGQLTISSPGQGVNWAPGSTQTIQWSGGAATVDLMLVDRDRNAIALVIAEGIPNAQRYGWAVPATLQGGNFMLYIKDPAGAYAYGPVFSILPGPTPPPLGLPSPVGPPTPPVDTSPPDPTITGRPLAISSPGQGVNWAPGSTQTIQWSGGAGTVDLMLADRDRNAIALVIAEGIPNAGSYGWALPASLRGGNFMLYIKDPAGAYAYGPVFSILPVVAEPALVRPSAVGPPPAPSMLPEASAPPVMAIPYALGPPTSFVTPDTTTSPLTNLFSGELLGFPMWIWWAAGGVIVLLMVMKK